MREVERLVADTMENIYNEYVRYTRGDININEFLVIRYNIIVRSTYLNHLNVRPSEFLDVLGFDLIHEAKVLHELLGL